MLLTTQGTTHIDSSLQEVAQHTTWMHRQMVAPSLIFFPFWAWCWRSSTKHCQLIDLKKKNGMRIRHQSRKIKETAKNCARHQTSLSGRGQHHAVILENLDVAEHDGLSARRNNTKNAIEKHRVVARCRKRNDKSPFLTRLQQDSKQATSISKLETSTRPSTKRKNVAMLFIVYSR